MTAALCPECEGRGSVPATPGQPGDGPEPCPACSELTRCSEECWRAGWCDKSCESPDAVAVPRRKQDAAFVRRSCLSPGCPNEVEPGELDCETHRAASLNYERVALIVTEAFNRYHRGEHSDPVFIEHDIADGISLERRRLRGEVESDA